MRGEIRKVEVLRDVKGLSPADVTDSVEVEIGGLLLNVLAPQKVLKAKICNSVEIEQSDRNDVRHVRIIVHCVRLFISDYLEAAESGELTQRDAVDLVEEVREVVSSPLAAKAAKMWGFDFSQVWPEELWETKLDKLARFAEHRLRRATD